MHNSVPTLLLLLVVLMVAVCLGLLLLQVSLYAGVGFKLLGPSPVEHGADQWLEMAFVVTPTT
jgi:hypothetical protein